MQRGETAAEETVQLLLSETIILIFDGVRATPKPHVSQLSPHAYSSRVRGGDSIALKCCNISRILR